MQTNPDQVRVPVPLKVLWKWTGVSTALHVLGIGALCGLSYMNHQKAEAARQAKAAAEDAALKKKEAEDAAKAATNAPPVGVTNAPAAPPSGPLTAVPTPATTNRQAEAEKALGIDKIAKPGDLPKSPFSSKNDDLLKDLK